MEKGCTLNHCRKAWPISQKDLDFNSVPQENCRDCRAAAMQGNKKTDDQRQQLEMETPIKSFRQQMGKAHLSLFFKKKKKESKTQCTMFYHPIIKNNTNKLPKRPSLGYECMNLSILLFFFYLSIQYFREPEIYSEVSQSKAAKQEGQLDLLPKTENKIWEIWQAEICHVCHDPFFAITLCLPLKCI